MGAGYRVPPLNRFLAIPPERLTGQSGFWSFTGLPATIELGSCSWSKESDMVAARQDWDLGDVTQGGANKVITLRRDTVG